MRKILSMLAIGCCACLMACGSSGKTVVRIDENSTTDLSGKWNDTDSRIVADEMIRSCLTSAKVGSAIQAMGKTPTVIVGKIHNKSYEHISVGTFIKDIERVLINSGEVDFVANAQQSAELRQELASQQGNASEETVKAPGEESGADWMLVGTINAIVDQEGGNSVVFYQVDMELIDIQSHKKLWIGDKKIKKFISRDAVRL